MLDDVGGSAATGTAGLPAVLEPRVLVPAQVFAPGGVEALLARIAAEVRSVKTDISTAAGRDQIRSLAYRIARSKTALDKAGQDLTEEWRQKTAVVNAERRNIRDFMDALADEVRKPLTDWEAVEKQRVAAHEAALVALVQGPAFYAEAHSVTLEMTLEHLTHIAATPERDWQEFSARAAETVAAEITTCKLALARAQKREAEAAELARLRAEAAERARQEAERQRVEHEARIAAEAAERARREAEERAAHAARAAAEQAEAERRAAAKLQAELEAKQREAEERAAAAERARVAAEARAKVDAEEAQRRAEAARVAAEQKAERDRQAAVEEERRRVAAEQAKAAREAEARAANTRHRAKINNAVADALALTGLDAAQAKRVVVAIASGQIPYTSISY